MAKILLVEDDKSLREIYGVRLMAEGYEIVSAGDGEEALAMAIKERPDLIVSDVMMPKISGFDMLDILRSTTETKDVKVIMMTALSSDDQRERGESLGADRYLVKSQVGIEDVVRTVHDVLGDSSIAPAAPVAAAAAPSPTQPPVTPNPVPVPVIDQSTAPLQNAPAQPQMPTPEPLAAPVAPAPITPEPIMAAPTSAPVAPPMPSGIPAEPTSAPSLSELPPAPAPIAPQNPLNPLAAVPPTPEVPQQPFASVAPPTPLIAPQPETPSSLPQPTAPFSSPAPASLGERVIEPLSPITTGTSNDIANQIEQALNTPTPPGPGAPPAA